MIDDSLGTVQVRPFRERFTLRRFDDGGVLLDLDRGAFFRLDPLGAAVCAGLERGESLANVVTELAARVGVAPEVLARDCETMLTQLKLTRPTRGQNPIAFGADAHGLLMHWEDRPVLHVDNEGRTVTTVDVGAAEAALLWAAPHLLVLQGVFVLHAAAVRWGVGALGLCGASGVGKTTLARLLTDCGHTLIAEDLLVCSSVESGVAVGVDGETSLRAWVADQAPLLRRHGRIDAHGVAAVASGPLLPLHEVFVLERASTEEKRLKSQQLPAADALVLLLQHGFAELGTRAVWESLFERTAHLCATIPVSRVVLPEGLDQLAEAVAAYSATVT